MAEKIRNNKYGLTLVEVLVVVAILGILAAIAFPAFQNHTTKAREAAAKDNLRILRNAIEVYAAQHDDVPPGFTNDDISQSPGSYRFLVQMTGAGGYLSEIPENPINESSKIWMDNTTATLSEPVNYPTYGWLYQARTKTVKLNSPGSDSTGKLYFDY